jgi:hypothetical protein
VALVQTAHPTADVEVGASDEHRLGRQPLLRPVWARRGQRPVARVQRRFEWRSLLACVHPASGRRAWQFASTLNSAVLQVALEAFARAVGAGPAKRIVLARDQAGYHASPLVQVPDGLHLVFLPPYSPELQPADHLWQFTDDPLVNQRFPTLAALDDTLATRLPPAATPGNARQRPATPARRAPKRHPLSLVGCYLIQKAISAKWYQS